MNDTDGTPPHNIIDIATSGKRGVIEIEREENYKIEKFRESTEDKKARLDKEKLDADQKRLIADRDHKWLTIRENSTYFLTVLLIVFFLIASVYVLNADPAKFDPELRRLATNVIYGLASLAVGKIGYDIGKARTRQN